MTRGPVTGFREGHRIGGLLSLWALAFLGCAPVEDGGPGAPEPVRSAGALEVYRELGLITGTADFPAVADIATLAGPADSTLLLFGLSLPTSALRFQRDGDGFSAGYVVGLRAERDSQLVALVDRTETVRVPDFAETGRSDESVLFQTAMVLAPGEHVLSIRVRDGLSARGFERADTIAVPAYGATGRTLAAPLPVYRAAPRSSRAAAPDLVLNPRHTAPYGGPVAAVYVEAYDRAPVRLELRDVRGEAVWDRPLSLEGGAGLGAAVVVLPVDSLPLGRFTVVAVSGESRTAAVSYVVTLSDQWLAANLSDVLGLFRYIASDEELGALREADAVERRGLWDAFWADRDPVPATPVNEYRDELFDRIRVATVEFAEPGTPGWRTDRGEVYIVLGPPARITALRYDPYRAADRTRAEEWVYDRVPGGRLGLVFVDRSGLGTYALTAESAAAFRAAAQRIDHIRIR